MNEHKLAVVLGGTVPHIQLIHKLKQRGFHTVLIDYFPDPPAKAAADEHIQESTLDHEAVLEIARSRNARLVITTCIDQANVTAIYVAERLGLPTPYSYDTALLVSNKSLMKKRMIDAGIPTSQYRIVTSSETTVPLRFPLIVKPVDGNSSKGVRRVNGQQQLSAAIAHALSISRDGRAIVEEFIQGEEVGVDCFVADGTASIVMTRVRKKIVAHELNSQQIFGSIWPARLSPENYERLSEIANDIVRTFGLDNTPLLIQAMIHEDEISVIEFAPRIGGGENHQIIKNQTGFDIIDAAIDSFLGQAVEPDFHAPESYSVDCYLYVVPGLYGGPVRQSVTENSDVADYIVEYKSRGSAIGGELSSNNRVGAFVVTGDKLDDISRKIDRTIAAMDVVDPDGNSILRRNMYGPFIKDLAEMNSAPLSKDRVEE